MPRVIFSQGAVNDLERLQNFLKQKNRAASRRASETIITGVGILENHPDAGKPVEEMTPEFRALVIGFGKAGYVVLYRYNGGDIVISAIRHQLEAGY